ncbi:MAG: hypothetical protein ACO2PN_28660 [Pyrobaculum sp.]
MESLRQVQALVEAADPPRGRSSRGRHAESTPATKPAASLCRQFQPSLSFWEDTYITGS